jgi:hypothetical protein
MKWILTASIATVALVTTFVAALLNAPVAYACSCVSRSAAEYLDRADVVVVGKVARDFKPPSPRLPYTSSDLVLNVERYLKGSGTSLVFIDDEGGNCGFFWGPFDDEEFLVFLRGEGEPYETSLCSGSSYLGEERGDTLLSQVWSITGPGVSPSPALASSDSRWESRPLWFVTGAVSAILTIVLTAPLALFIIRRLKGTEQV